MGGSGGTTGSPTIAPTVISSSPLNSGGNYLSSAVVPVVTYEEFGAVGDGVTDDLPAIIAAHAHANAQNLPVRAKPGATYHLGGQALTAIIQTDTDWGTARFIIDDSQGVENHKKSLFEIQSRLEPVPLAIDRLARGQKRLEARPATALLVYVENRKRKMFIRKGLNRNSGVTQREVFILHPDGLIEGAIEWDYDVITSVEAYPIDPQPLFVRGGVFINIANQMRQDVGYNYWSRNIMINRSNTEIDGVQHQVVGETDFGHPYQGFLSVRKAANITLRNCQIDGRKFYRTIGGAGRTVSMGSYGYNANLVVNFRMIKCRTSRIHDTTRWGVIATNFMKNILLEDSELSRMDTHQGTSGDFIIRRTILGHQGLNAVGRGRLLIEDSTLHGRNLINFRSDYGATWEGDVEIRNSRWIPPANGSSGLMMFSTQNDGTHDFGFPCFMPREVRIEGLYIDDSRQSGNYTGAFFFSGADEPPAPERPFPYRLTERLEVSGLTTARGLPVRVSANPELVEAITLVWPDEMNPASVSSP